jgi:hypothetical protein
VLCREHGLQLSELAAENKLDGFGLFGVIKETGVDDMGLSDFYEKHFKYPLYRDVNLDFYRAFGDGKITDSWTWSTIFNPFKIARDVKQMGKRLKEKGLEGNFKGEGMKTGGIIIFDNNFQPKYMYPEITGRPLDTDDILAAVNAVRGGAMEEAEAHDTGGTEL